MDDLVRHFYNDDYHCFQQPHEGGFFAQRLQQLFDVRTNDPRFKELKRRFPDQDVRLLDVGCGNGSLLRYIAERTAWKVQGVEPNPTACKAAVQAGVATDVGYLQDQGYADEQFHAITLTHVLEHVDSPTGLLREIHRILKPGGILLLEVPNSNALDRGYMGKYWWGWHLPRHLHHFTSETLSQMVGDVGFNVLSDNYPLRFGSMAWNFSILSQWHPWARKIPLSPFRSSNPLLLLLAMPFETAGWIAKRSSLLEMVLQKQQ